MIFASPEAVAHLSGQVVLLPTKNHLGTSTINNEAGILARISDALSSWFDKALRKPSDTVVTPDVAAWLCGCASRPEIA